MPVKTILVAGATGKQGRALIRALAPTSSPPSTAPNSNPEDQDTFHILALTRSSTSPSALSLRAAYPEDYLTLVQGDLDDEASVRSVFTDAQTGGGGGGGGVWAVFCVLAFPGLGKNGDGEEKQGKTLASLAHQFGVKHYILSSAERGGEKDDDTAALERQAKVRIERYVKQLGEGEAGLNWTILRPAFFMENFDGTLGSITMGVLKAGLKPDTKLQLIAADDIGLVGASVLRDPTSYIHKALVVVGDTLTIPEIEESYKRGTGGKKMPSLAGWLAGALIWMNQFTKALLVDIERASRNRQDTATNGPILEGVELTRRANPNMTTFEEWARKRQEAEKGESTVSKREKNWNGLSLKDLITGKV